MVRMKKGCKGDKEATEKWRKTMEKRFGDVSAKMKKIGAMGGKNGKGGFAAHPELAKKYGSLGGLISKRGRSYKKEWNENKFNIMNMYDSGDYSMMDLSKKFGIPYGAIVARIKKESGNR